MAPSVYVDGAYEGASEVEWKNDGESEVEWRKDLICLVSMRGGMSIEQHDIDGI